MSGTGRYVRVHGTARASGYGYSIWDVDVHTSGSAATNVALPGTANPVSVSPTGPAPTERAPHTPTPPAPGRIESSQKAQVPAKSSPTPSKTVPLAAPA